MAMDCAPGLGREKNFGKRMIKETKLAFIKKPPVSAERTLHPEKSVSELLDEYCRFDCAADCAANFSLRKMQGRDPGYRKRKASRDGAKGNTTKPQATAGKP